MTGEWLKFNNCEFSADSQKEFRKRHSENLMKEIKRPEALDIDEFGRHSGKEKVTLGDLFLLHSMDGGVRVDVPWHVAKFFTEYKNKSPIVGAHLIGRVARSFGLMTQGSLRSVTLGPETSLLNVAKLVDLGICRYNGLGYSELVDDIPDNGEDEGAGDDDAWVVRCRPNMSFTNRLRAVDERLGEMETDISRLGNDVDDLTYAVSGMFEQYDQFYGEFGQMRMEQERLDLVPYSLTCRIPKNLLDRVSAAVLAVFITRASQTRQHGSECEVYAALFMRFDLSLRSRKSTCRLLLQSDQELEIPLGFLKPIALVPPLSRICSSLSPESKRPDPVAFLRLQLGSVKLPGFNSLGGSWCCKTSGVLLSGPDYKDTP
ncbi:hypothetical protein Tco_1294736 [Tanacetum coccineum]